MLRLYGAEIVDSPGEEGSNGAVRLALELAEGDPSFFMPFQYANEANPRAHYEGTGAEIASNLDRVDVLVAGLGTGGTLMGAGARLRESQGRVNHRPGGDPREDRLSLEEQAEPEDGLLVGDKQLPVELGDVEDRGHVAVRERA